MEGIGMGDHPAQYDHQGTYDCPEGGKEQEAVEQGV
jgi:hypothetical protein